MRWVILVGAIGYAVHVLVPLIKAPYPVWGPAEWARVLPPAKDKP